MAEWRIPVTIDGHQEVLVVGADTAVSAAAVIARDRAAAVGNPTRCVPYRTSGGGRIEVRWGRVGVADIGRPEPA